MKEKTNIATSIRQRLRNLARERGENFQQLLVSYALERVLYRLGQSRHRDRFVLKGALLFRLWFDLTQRPTRDADFLGFGNAEPEEFAKVFREIAGMVEDDGLVFDAGSVKVVDIRKEAGYPGVRVNMTATLDGAHIPVQCDIGFGDAVTPAPLQQATTLQFILRLHVALEKWEIQVSEKLLLEAVMHVDETSLRRAGLP